MLEMAVIHSISFSSVSQMNQLISLLDLVPAAIDLFTAELSGKSGLFGTIDVYSPAASNSGASLRRRPTVGDESSGSAYQLKVLSSCRTSVPSLQLEPNNLSKNCSANSGTVKYFNS